MKDINEGKGQGIVLRSKNEFLVHSSALVSRGLALARQLTSQASHLTRKRAVLLVVEDSKELRDVLLEHLSAFFPELFLETASNGVEALEKVDHQLPDYLITNINMPKMDGISLIGVLHQRGIALPILATSGWWEEDAFRSRIAEEGITSVGGVSFLKKPFRLDSLVTWLDTVRGTPSDSATQYGRASMYYQLGEYEKAAHWFLKAAEQGNTEAQYMTGYMHYEWVGQMDTKQVIKWFLKAAGRGHSEAQCVLGDMYENGYGVSEHEDPEKAIAWYRQAVAGWYRKAVDQEDAEAQCRLGDMYSHGNGVPRDDEKAIAWYRRAAAQGYSDGQYRLAEMYYHGFGVPKDLKKSLGWYRKAAEQGYEYHQYMLADRYCEDGDYKEAVAWYRKAAEQRKPATEISVGPVSRRPRTRWLGGHPGAQFSLGRMYYDGQGVPQNYEEATEWLRKAAGQGHAEARNFLKKLGR